MKHQTIENPLHRTRLLDMTPNFKYQRICQLMTGMDKDMELFLKRAEGEGEDLLAASYDLFKLLKGISKQTLLSALLTAKLAKAKSVYSLIDYYARMPVLCLDELGYVIPTKDQADAIFQIISKRTETGTIIVTTNLIPSDWGKIFDTVTASAILDRLNLNGKFITFEGRSCRSKK